MFSPFRLAGQRGETMKNAYVLRLAPDRRRQHMANISHHTWDFQFRDTNHKSWQTEGYIFLWILYNTAHGSWRCVTCCCCSFFYLNYFIRNWHIQKERQSGQVRQYKKAVCFFFCQASFVLLFPFIWEKEMISTKRCGYHTLIHNMKWS